MTGSGINFFRVQRAIETERLDPAAQANIDSITASWRHNIPAQSCTPAQSHSRDQRMIGSRHSAYCVVCDGCCVLLRLPSTSRSVAGAFAFAQSEISSAPRSAAGRWRIINNALLKALWPRSLAGSPDW